MLVLTLQNLFGNSGGVDLCLIFLILVLAHFFKLKNVRASFKSVSNSMHTLHISQ